MSVHAFNDWSASLTALNGDARGRWEGDTLVVETRNFSTKSEFREATDNLQLVERFTRGVAHAAGETLTLSAARFDAAFGRAGAAQTPPEHPADVTVAGWLSEQEIRHRAVVYIADAAASCWTRSPRSAPGCAAAGSRRTRRPRSDSTPWRPRRGSQAWPPTPWRCGSVSGPGV